jgi:hypothetical protein
MAVHIETIAPIKKYIMIIFIAQPVPVHYFLTTATTTHGSGLFNLVSTNLLFLRLAKTLIANNRHTYKRRPVCLLI